MVAMAVYAGQPGRTMPLPTVEPLLISFREVILPMIELPGQMPRHLRRLTALQQRILDLLDCSPTIYTHRVICTAPHLRHPTVP